MNIILLNNLKKYYIHFDNKYNILLECKTDDETFNMFQILWGIEHGGLYRLDEDFNPPEILPYYKNKQICITEIIYKNIK